MQVHIRKARIIDPQSDFHNQITDLLIEDGIITEIGSDIKGSKKSTIDAKGLCVSPGWVDVFADYREPGYEQKETIETGLATAAAGGFTDVMLAPNTQPALSTKSAVQFALQRAMGNAVTLHPIGTATKNGEGKELAEMLDMHANGAKVFSDGWKPVQEGNLMLKALEYVKAFNGTLIQLPIETSLSAGGLMNEGIVSTKLGMSAVPKLAETIMVHRDLELLRYTGSKLHISGITTAESVEMIRRAKKEGLKITCSVTPYHLALTDEALTTYDSVYKVSPPLRGEADRLALVEGLKDGTIDSIASHHKPHEWDAKTKEFEYASDGMALQQSAFNVAWTAIEPNIDAERLVEAMSTIPRDIFGLDQPVVKVGSKACVTIFTTEGNTTLANSKSKSLSHNNPFLEKELKGRVLGIINNSQLHLNN